MPADVITSQDFSSQGDADLSNLLRTLAPSYNVNAQPISDASTIVQPLSLRNLAGGFEWRNEQFEIGIGPGQ